MGLRSSFGAVTKKIPALHRLLVFLYHFAVLEAWPRIIRRRNGNPTASHEIVGLREFLSLQTIRVLGLGLPTPANDGELVDALRSMGIPFSEGGWTIYVHPSKEILDRMPQLRDYPANSGVKILRHLAPPGAAAYTPNELRPTPGAAQVRARTPDLKTLLRMAGHLAAEEIGPVVHDLVELRIGTARCTAFIVDDAGTSEGVTTEDYEQFVVRLNTVLDKEVVAVAHGNYRLSRDFRSPDCSGNLVKDYKGCVRYVDVQSFTFKDEMKAFTEWSKENSSQILFGPKRMGKNEDYLYQMIPGVGEGKRGTTERWKLLDELVLQAGLDFTDRITFDVGCNSGLMSYYALSKGAKWAYGWDKPEIALASQRLLRLLGASRWTAVGCSIEENTEFITSVQENHQCSQDGILLYFAISNHIGFPKGIAELPWKYCVYEGHSNQDIDYSLGKIKASGWQASIEVLATGIVRDGDSPDRSVILFSR